MFYKKEEVDSVLICPLCTGILRDPRILPCGTTACHSCIQQRSDSENQFECQTCREKHQPSRPEGFFPNKIVLKLIESKASDVYRGEKVERLKSMLDEIKSVSDSFKVNLNKGPDEITEYCTVLRNEVHLQAEILIEKVHKLNEKLIAEIDSYEKECLKVFDNKSVEKERELDEFLAKMNTFYSENSKYLSEFVIDEVKVEDSLSQANSYLYKLKKKQNKVKRVKFNSNLMGFKKKAFEEEESLVGSMEMSNLCLTMGKVNETRFNQLVTDYSHNHSKYFLFKFGIGINVAFYMNANSNLTAVFFDDEGKQINKITSLFPDCKCVSFQVAHVNDKFYIYAELSYAQPVAYHFVQSKTNSDLELEHREVYRVDGRFEFELGKARFFVEQCE
jgi:hypothetical protein